MSWQAYNPEHARTIVQSGCEHCDFRWFGDESEERGAEHALDNPTHVVVALASVEMVFVPKGKLLVINGSQKLWVNERIEP
jgi:hypothetical protein